MSNTCVVCLKESLFWREISSDVKLHFCSIECLDKFDEKYFQYMRKSEIMGNKYREGRIQAELGKSCMMCHKEAVWVEVASEGTFCSAECENEFYKKISLEENGGITTIENLKHGFFKFPKGEQVYIKVSSWSINRYFVRKTIFYGISLNSGNIVKINPGKKVIIIGMRKQEEFFEKFSGFELLLNSKEQDSSIIPMLLWCPECGQRHIDEGEYAEKPHSTHACQHCGMVWKPCKENTVGVSYLPGYKN